MSAFKALISQAHALESKIGYTFKDPTLLGLAFVHRSFVNENADTTEHNERLEFLGDAVLGLLISDYLYRTFPQHPEGDLSYLRSRLIEANSCYLYLQSLDLGSYVLLGRGEKYNSGRGRESILADLFEALIGAIYLDGGLEAAKSFLFDHFSSQFVAILKTPLSNWKALLQDYCQKNYQQPPTYHVIQESGPDHSKQFIISVKIKETEIGRGSGHSKKEAQQAAAENAIMKQKS